MWLGYHELFETEFSLPFLKQTNPKNLFLPLVRIYLFNNFGLNKNVKS